jgi:hypothetical protein
MVCSCSASIGDYKRPLVAADVFIDLHQDTKV